MNVSEEGRYETLHYYTWLTKSAHRLFHWAPCCLLSASKDEPLRGQDDCTIVLGQALSILRRGEVVPSLGDFTKELFFIQLFIQWSNLRRVVGTMFLCFHDFPSTDRGRVGRRVSARARVKWERLRYAVCSMAPPLSRAPPETYRIDVRNWGLILGALSLNYAELRGGKTNPSILIRAELIRR